MLDSPTERTPRIVVLGDATIDLVLEVPGLPGPGEDALATRQSLGLGGSAANTAVMLRHLGATVSLACSVGLDAFGDAAVESLAAEGIEIDGIARDVTEPTSINVVAVTADAERTMLAYRGASACLRPDALDERAISSADALHVSAYAFLASPQRDAARRALELAQESGVLTTIDIAVPAAESAGDELRRAIRGLGLLVTGLPEAERITGDRGEDACVAALLEAGVQRVALKRGAAGALVATSDTRIEVPGFRVDVVDSTGAGDAFAAGILHGLLVGASLEDAGRLGNACGAAAVTRRGAGRALPTHDDVRTLLAVDR